MTASSLIDSLAGRGLVLSIEGTRIQASPKRLLTDQDRRLIRQFRDDLLTLLSKGVAAKTYEEAERDAIRKEPLIASSPDIRFHDELRLLADFVETNVGPSHKCNRRHL